MSISAAWPSRLWKGLINTALAQDCLFCGAPSGEAPLCGACRAGLPALAPGCPVCALPNPAGGPCGACLSRPPKFDATLAAWPYVYPVDRLVQALKFHGRLALASFFARALAARVAPVDIIMPMPLHASRLAERGFNQAAEIARHLAADQGIRLSLQGSTRIRRTLSQADLPFVERSQNVRGAFACPDGIGELGGARVAVVDDVMTTGATLNELAGTLKRAGAIYVENWVVARTLE